MLQLSNIYVTAFLALFLAAGCYIFVRFEWQNARVKLRAAREKELRRRQLIREVIAGTRQPWIMIEICAAYIWLLFRVAVICFALGYSFAFAIGLTEYARAHPDA